MKKRRRLQWLLGTAGALAALWGVIFFVFAPPPSISLTMAGHASVDMAAGPYPGDSPWRLVPIPCALIRVTNVDDLPVRVLLSVPTNALEEMGRRHDLTTRYSARIYFGAEQAIDRNTSIVVPIPLAQPEQVWQADFTYYRMPLRGKLAAWLSEQLPAPIENLLRRFESRPTERFLRIGPFTNASPTSAHP